MNIRYTSSVVVLNCCCGWDAYISSLNVFFTGLLPREVRQIVHSSCALHFYDCMEGCFPVYWQKNQKQGTESLSLLNTHFSMFWLDQQTGGLYGNSSTSFIFSWNFPQIQKLKSKKRSGWCLELYLMKMYHGKPSNFFTWNHFKKTESFFLFYYRYFVL